MGFESQKKVSKSVPWTVSLLSSYHACFASNLRTLALRMELYLIVSQAIDCGRCSTVPA